MKLVGGELMQIDPGVSAVLVSIVGLVGIFVTVKAANSRADRSPAPPPRATLEDVSSLEEHLSAEIRALQGLLGEVIGKLSAKTTQVDTMRRVFLDYVSTVSRVWGRTANPPQLTEEQEAALYDDEEPASYNTQATRQALREHRLVTLRDNPPPETPTESAPRRPRH